MTSPNDFLLEIHTEELPPKTLLSLATALSDQIKKGLDEVGTDYQAVRFFATPRRLAVLITELACAQPDQIVEKKGPALKAAFDAEGKPTSACIGFARSLGVTPAQLTTLQTEQGAWVVYKQAVLGKSVTKLLPAIVERAILALPIAKRMRWGAGETQFVRPVHAVMMLYGSEVIPAVLLGHTADRQTRGHRFHANQWFSIRNASCYEDDLKTQLYVLPDFNQRQEKIRTDLQKVMQAQLGDAGSVLIDEALLAEVSGLVEWPVVLCGHFEQAFLSLPREVLISAMQDHQRYFPVVDHQHHLLPYFMLVSNIESTDRAKVVQGNERVLRARLSDAAFFYDADQKESLAERLPRLKSVVFQAKLGTLYDKAQRLSELTGWLAEKCHRDVLAAKRAGLLAKADLVTQMVGEFPELQGIMGQYYAKHDGESELVQQAVGEQYLPRFAGDVLPASKLGPLLAVADRVDILVGAFGINQLPTGDKDPYGLRRAAVGLLRLLINKQISLDLQELLALATRLFQGRLDNVDIVLPLMNFISERLRAWYQEQGVAADVFASVASLKITNLLDLDRRIQAVLAFKQCDAALALSAANKRVSNILAKYTEQISGQQVNPDFFEHPAEQALADQLELKNKQVQNLSQTGQYAAVLMALADLRQSIDAFFDHVMVMTEDKAKRENRILLLSKLRALFLQVADIALLQ